MQTCLQHLHSISCLTTILNDMDALLLLNVFALILNVSMLYYCEQNILEALLSVLRDMNFTEAILNVFPQTVLMFQMLY